MPTTVDSNGTSTRQPSRPPLPYRLISFHRGCADKPTIVRAQEVGFNGVQFILEGGNVGPLKDFAERNAREGYLDFCHRLGMKTTLWVHELSEIPGPGAPDYLGPVEPANEKLWSHLAARYEWLLGELVPEIDGLVLTVVETQINAADAALMRRIALILHAACRRHGKELIVRTFVWYPKEFAAVMECVRKLPEDVIVMTKCVPQDWQMRGIPDAAIGDVGRHRQIIEYDIAGEYFLQDAVANCMPTLLKEQFDYGLSRGVIGICARVDRTGPPVLHLPQEVNLWALGHFASGRTDSVEEVWHSWAAARYGKDAAAGVIRALKPTQRVIEECLSVDRLTFGDTRGFPPPNGDTDAFDCNWQNWRWNPAFVPLYERTRTGDPDLLRETIAAKEKAFRLADLSLAELEQARSKLEPIEYDLLKQKLEGNRAHLEFRAPMMIAYLRYCRLLNTTDPAEKTAQSAAIRILLGQIREIAARPRPPVRRVEHLGRRWRLGPPDRVDWEKVRAWADQMEKLVAGHGI